MGVNRRDFLRPRSFRSGSDAREGARVGAGSSTGPFAGSGPSTGWGMGRGYELVRAHRPAMGSSFEIRLPTTTPGAVELACRALDLVDALEAQMTVYRDSSEIRRLNASAHLGPVAVEPRLFRLLQDALALSAETGGAYDVTSGALSEAWGFVKGPKRVPAPEVLADARARTGWRHLRLDAERRTVAFDRAGIQINLGSIGKGHAIDRVVDLLRAHWWPTPGLVHGGRSSLYALGPPPGRTGGRWEIALYNPFRPEAPLGTFRLKDRALGTSGTAFQRFQIDGRDYGHILDPRTGAPADGPASVTVLAPTAAAADALSTAFYLMSNEAVAAYVDAHPEIGAVIVVAPEKMETETENRGQGQGARAAPPRLSIFGLKEHDFVAAADPLG